METSSLIVFCPTAGSYKAINLATGVRYARLSGPILDVLWDGLEGVAPDPTEEIQPAIHAAAEEGLLRVADGPDSGGAWERANWTRAAFLTFSQLNLSYSEREAASRSLSDLRE